MPTGSGVVRGSTRGNHRAVPDAEAGAGREGLGESIGAEFRRRRNPEGVLWEVRVGCSRLCGTGAADDDDDDGLVEFSQVVLQRFTASTVEEY